MSVSYCITCDKKLCPHHQQVFTDTQPQCTFGPKLPELLDQNHNLVSLSIPENSEIMHCGMLFEIYNTVQIMMIFELHCEFFCTCTMDVATITLYTSFDCLSESRSELSSTFWVSLTYKYCFLSMSECLNENEVTAVYTF